MQREDYVKLEGIKSVSLESKYDKLDDFHEGLAAAGIRKGNRLVWGYINKNLDEVVQPIYEHAYDFHEGLACTFLNGSYGYINTKGEVIINHKYNEADDFHEGLAYVKNRHERGYINKTGELQIKLEDSEFSASRFSEGLAHIGKGKYINNKGEEVINIKCDNAFDLHEGLIRIEKSGKYGYVDTQGNIVIPCKFIMADDFHNGHAKVFFQDRMDYGYIDKSGKETRIVRKFDETITFSEGLAAVAHNGRYGYINEEGKEVIPYSFISASDFHDGVAKVKILGEHGKIYNEYINKKGQLLVSTQEKERYYPYNNAYMLELENVKIKGFYTLLADENQVVVVESEKYNEHEDRVNEISDCLREEETADLLSELASLERKSQYIKK